MTTVLPPGDVADLERRFGGLRRLYGNSGYDRLRTLRIAVVGLGGVGSWAVEALARSGIASLVLIDLDQVAESNINRQVQALGSTVGQAKTEALRARVADIHPACAVHAIEEFADARNWPGLLPIEVDGLIDACDQTHAKLALAAWALQQGGMAFVCAGAAGGKRSPERVEVADLSDVTHDPLLASLRQRLRRQGARRQGPMGLRCVYSRESVAVPTGEACELDGSLNCAGYGSSVMVTATVGMIAAAEIVNQCLVQA